MLDAIILIGTNNYPVILGHDRMKIVNRFLPAASINPPKSFAYISSICPKEDLLLEFFTADIDIDYNDFNLVYT